MLMEMVKQDIKKGITKDWGAFVGEMNGYSVLEGTELEILSQVQQYTPFVYQSSAEDHGCKPVGESVRFFGLTLGF
jgi:hypothetical protein